MILFYFCDLAIFLEALILCIAYLYVRFWHGEMGERILDINSNSGSHEEQLSVKKERSKNTFWFEVKVSITPQEYTSKYSLLDKSNM